MLTRPVGRTGRGPSSSLFDTFRYLRSSAKGQSQAMPEPGGLCEDRQRLLLIQ
jgi:hypothetical protein